METVRTGFYGERTDACKITVHSVAAIRSSGNHRSDRTGSRDGNQVEVENGWKPSTEKGEG